MKIKGKLVVLLTMAAVISSYFIVRSKSTSHHENTSKVSDVNRSGPLAAKIDKQTKNASSNPLQTATSGDQRANSKADKEDSYFDAGNNNRQTVKTVDRLQRSRISALSSIQANEGPLKSMKDRHITSLLSKPVLEKRSWQDPVSANEIRATLVEDEDSQYRHYIVKQIHKPGEKEPVNTYVQIANHILVRFSKEPSNAEIQQFSARHQLSLNKKLLLPRTYLFEFSEVSIERLQKLEAAIAKEPDVETVDVNSLTYPTLTPNDPLFRNLWGLQNTGVDPLERINFVEGIDITATQAWDDLTDCSSTVVAVLDTGIDPNHPDLQANVLADLSRNFTTNNAADFIDRQAHGTHVAGTIGAVGNNGVGIAGVCWKASIIAVKVLNDEGFGTLQSMLDGLMYVSQTNAKVLNLSLGGAPPTNMEQQAIAANTSAGKLLVIAAGNENNNNDQNPTYPASYPDPGIISVAALQGAGDLANFSNFGANSVHIAAPGQDIVSTIPVALAENNAANAYRAFSGTSMAAPHVAGAVALFWSYASELTPQQVKQELLDNSDTGTFSKAVAGSRIMNLAKMMDAVKAKAQFVNVTSGDTVTLRNGNSYDLNLSVVEKYADITSIEILHGEEVVGRSSGAVDSLSIKFPLGYSQVELVAKVTDAEGRVYYSEPIELAVDIDKILKFSALDLSSIQGSVPCSLIKTDASGAQQQLFQASLESERACQKLCEIIGPLAFSSRGEITCASSVSTLYNKAADDLAAGGE